MGMYQGTHNKIPKLGGKMYPCTPPLLLLGLSQNLVHLSPQLWDFIMCTLVHWYIFTLVHCHVPCTHVLLHFCYLDLVKIWYIFHPNFGILLYVPWYIGTLVHWTL